MRRIARNWFVTLSPKFNFFKQADFVPLVILTAKLHLVPATMRLPPLLPSTRVTQPQATHSLFCKEWRGTASSSRRVLHLNCLSTGGVNASSEASRQRQLSPYRVPSGSSGEMRGWVLHSWKRWALLTPRECHSDFYCTSVSFLFIPIALIQILAWKKLSAFLVIIFFLSSLY